MESLFVDVIHPCGRNELQEHPARLQEHMSEYGIVPPNADFSTITLELSSSGHCEVCCTSSYTARKKTVLWHTFICGHNKAVVMHPSVISALRYLRIFPETDTAIRINVNSAFCRDCQRLQFDALHARLVSGVDQVLESPEPWKDHLGCFLLELNDAKVSGRISQRQFQELLDHFGPKCVQKMTTQETNCWLRKLIPNEATVHDIQAAVLMARNHMEKNQHRMGTKPS